MVITAEAYSSNSIHQVCHGHLKKMSKVNEVSPSVSIQFLCVCVCAHMSVSVHVIMPVCVKVLSCARARVCELLTAFVSLSVGTWFSFMCSAFLFYSFL